MVKTVRFYTLGCKVNQYDSEAMLEAFLQHGYRSAQPDEPADVYVVNTCTVTGTGDKKSMQAARRYKRQNPTGELVVAGCLAQRMGEQLRDTGARLIIGTQYRAQVVELLEQAMGKGTQLVAVDHLQSASFEPLTIYAHEGHTRAVMKIQEGCDNHCSYCIIPSVRGSIRSRKIDDVVTEAVALVNAGFQEMVLTGIHLTSYGRDWAGKPMLAEVVQAVHAIPGVERIRLGSLEPIAIQPAFIEGVAGLSNLCPQFHLALQSGSDMVLARMKRRYNTDQFRLAVQRLREVWPDVALTTDIIVGFPGETDDEFAQTIAFCKQIGFTKIHVFPFSPREGTPAATMEGQVPERVKEERVRSLIAVGEELAICYRERMLGTVQQVLLEERDIGGQHTGYTTQYIPVVCAGGEPGKIVKIRLTALTKEGMAGVVVE